MYLECFKMMCFKMEDASVIKIVKGNPDLLSKLLDFLSLKTTKEVNLSTLLILNRILSTTDSSDHNHKFAAEITELSNLDNLEKLQFHKDIEIMTFTGELIDHFFEFSEC